VFGKEGGDARQQIVVAVGVGPKDNVAIVVSLQIGDFAQQGDGVIAGGEAFNLPCGRIASCLIWWRWAGSSGMLALFERAVSDLAQQARVIVQGANVAPVDLVEVGVEMVVAQGLHPFQHRVDLALGAHECVEGFGIVGGVAGGHGLVVLR